MPQYTRTPYAPRAPRLAPPRFAPQSISGFRARQHLVISRWNEFGIFIFAAYLAAAAFYFSMSFSIDSRIAYLHARWQI